MDRDLIDAKLESLRRCVRRLESKQPTSPEQLQSNLDLQDIVVLNLERSVQTCVDIALHLLSDMDDAIAPPASMAEAFRTLQRGGIIDSPCASRMVKAVGFRNTAVHAYREIDYDIVYSILTKHLDDFRSFAEQVVLYIENTIGQDP